MRATVLFLLLLPLTATAEVRTATVEIKEVILDKPYEAMKGPAIDGNFDLKEFADRPFWLTSAEVEILVNGKPAPQHLCHSRIGLVPRHVKIPERDNHLRSLIAISQGLTNVKFPEGFGVKVRPNSKANRLSFWAQLQNHESVSTPVKVTLRATIKFETDRAKVKNLKHLRIDDHGDGGAHAVGEHVHGHFSVPPGQTVRDVKVPKSFLRWVSHNNIHYMRPHLHVYAKSIELYNQTEKKTVWKGLADSDLKTLALNKTDSYSSSEGFRLNPKDQYVMRTIYDNPGKEPGEGMAFLVVYRAE